jgi:hypothetical protein
MPGGAGRRCASRPGAIAQFRSGEWPRGLADGPKRQLGERISSCRLAEREARSTIDRVDDGDVLDRFFRRRLHRFTRPECPRQTATRPSWPGPPQDPAASPAPKRLPGSNRRICAPCRPHSIRDPLARHRRGRSGCQRNFGIQKHRCTSTRSRLPSSPEAMISSTRNAKGW